MMSTSADPVTPSLHKAATACTLLLAIIGSGCSGNLASLSPRQPVTPATDNSANDTPANGETRTPSATGITADPVSSDRPASDDSSPTPATSRPVSRPLIDNILFGPARSAEHGDWRLPERTVDVRFSSADGTRLHGWLSRARQPRHVILFTHGNGGNVSYSGDVLQTLRVKFQATCLVFDYRGYGRSRGKPTLEGVVADAAAARRYLASETGVAEQDIILWGHSMGGAIAIQLTQQLPPKALILDSTFSSLRDEAAHVSPNLAWMVSRKLWNSAEVIADYTGPVFIMHGDADRVIPWTQGRALYDAVTQHASAAGSAADAAGPTTIPRTFVRLPGGRHNSSLWHADAVQPLDRFLRQLPRAGQKN